MTPDERHLFTIGHSNHSLEKFLELLRQHGVEVDIRSQPYSRYAPHFNRNALRKALAGARIRYSFLGEELGEWPRGEEYYDAEGYVRYDRVAPADFFNPVSLVSSAARPSTVWRSSVRRKTRKAVTGGC